MRKFSKIAFLGLAIALTFTLAGCGQKSTTSNTSDQTTSANSSNSTGQIKVQETSGAVEVQLPDSPVSPTEKEIRKILENIFGDLKVTGYSSDVYGAGSMLVEYTPSQKPAPTAVPKFTKALKDKGYTVSAEHVDNKVGTAMYEGGKYTITITIDTTNSMVGISYIGK